VDAGLSRARVVRDLMARRNFTTSNIAQYLMWENYPVDEVTRQQQQSTSWKSSVEYTTRRDKPPLKMLFEHKFADLIIKYTPKHRI
jgi:hypothetical protein